MFHVKHSERKVEIMKCYECGMTYKKWESTGERCEGGEECHDWEQSLDDDE